MQQCVGLRKPSRRSNGAVSGSAVARAPGGPMSTTPLRAFDDGFKSFEEKRAEAHAKDRNPIAAAFGFPGAHRAARNPKR